MKFEFKQNLENFLDLWQLLGCEPPGIVVSVSERVICLKGSYSLDLKDCFALPAFAIRLEMKNTQVRTENNSHYLEIEPRPQYAACGQPSGRVCL